jgi:5-methylcytosine-specific restriction endonuclease McrA
MVDLAKLIAKTRDGFICKRCKKKVSGVNCQGSHIIPISKSKALQFVPDNIDTLCYHCHLNFWHKNPVEAVAWFKAQDPARLKRLITKANDPNTRSLKEFELEEIYLKLEQEYYKMTHNTL